MHGNPLIRVLVLTAALAVMALVVSSITRDLNSSHDANGADIDASVIHDANGTFSTQLTIQLSAPAKSLSLTSADGEIILIAPHEPGSTEETYRFNHPLLSDNSVTFLLNLTWDSPAPNHFLRLALELGMTETEELVLHSPFDMESHAITFNLQAP